MTREFHSPSNKVAGSIVASAFVFLTGLVGLFFVLLVSGADPFALLGVFALTFFLLLFFSLLIRAVTIVNVRSAYNWVFSKQARPAAEYQPKRAKQFRTNYGTNQPPSVDEIRDLKDGLRNWIPSNTPGGRKNLKSGPG